MGTFKANYLWDLLSYSLRDYCNEIGKKYTYINITPKYNKYVPSKCIGKHS